MWLIINLVWLGVINNLLYQFGLMLSLECWDSCCQINYLYSICLFVCASFKTGKKLLRHLQIFCNLKRLELKIRGKDGDLAVLASLLYCSPVLKSLCITFHSDGDLFTKGKSRVILETIWFSSSASQVQYRLGWMDFAEKWTILTLRYSY